MMFNIYRKLLKIFCLCLFTGMTCQIMAQPIPSPKGANPGLTKIFKEISGGEVSKVRFIPENSEAWYTRWKMLESAKKSIDVTYFLVQNDIFGNSFLGLLRKKAREGVKIRLMIDGRMIHTYWRWLGIDELNELVRDPNIQVKLYNQVPKAIVNALTHFDISLFLLSNHDKILIIDDCLSLTGGRNIGADYFSGTTENAISFRDSDILMEGKAVAAKLKTAFDEEWNSIKNVSIKPDLINFKSQTLALDTARLIMNNYINGLAPIKENNPKFSKDLKKLVRKYSEDIARFKNIRSYQSFELWHGEHARPVKILDKHSQLGFRDEIGYNLIKMIDTAREEILFQNPYIALTTEAWAALKHASARGVRIIMHTNGPDSSNHSVTQAFFCKEWIRMMADMPTLRIFCAPDEKHQLHSKVAVFDGQIAVIGTYNLDPLSMVVNSELVALVNSFEFASRVRLRTLKDIAVSKECRIQRLPNGSVKSIQGPDDNVGPDNLKKMEFLSRLQWLRPLI